MLPADIKLTRVRLLLLLLNTRLFHFLSVSYSQSLNLSPARRLSALLSQSARCTPLLLSDWPIPLPQSFFSSARFQVSHAKNLGIRAKLLPSKPKTGTPQKSTCSCLLCCQVCFSYPSIDRKQVRLSHEKEEGKNCKKFGCFIFAWGTRTISILKRQLGGQPHLFVLKHIQRAPVCVVSTTNMTLKMLA